MYALLNLVHTIITIYIWLLIIQAVLSWLVAFGVVNRHNRAVAMIGDFLWRVTEPLLRPIRRILPDLGGIDISPVILILLLWFIDNLMFEYLADGPLFGAQGPVRGGQTDAAGKVDRVHAVAAAAEGRRHQGFGPHHLRPEANEALLVLLAERGCRGRSDDRHRAHQRTRGSRP